MLLIINILRKQMQKSLKKATKRFGNIKNALYLRLRNDTGDASKSRRAAVAALHKFRSSSGLLQKNVL